MTFDDNYQMDRPPVISTQPADNLASRTREEVEASARKWFAIASEMREVQEELAADLEKALNLCQEYQRFMAMLNSPDPNMTEVRRLFAKYNMNFTENTHANYGIYLDGQDIGTNPEGIDNVEVQTEKVELIIDEEGHMRFIPVAGSTTVVPDWSEGEDIEVLTEPADLSWLNEPNPEPPPKVS